MKDATEFVRRRLISLEWPDGSALHFYDGDEQLVLNSAFGRSPRRRIEDAKRRVSGVHFLCDGTEPTLTVVKDGERTEVYLETDDGPR